MRASSGQRQTFRGITRTIFNRLRKRASQLGIPIRGHVGNAFKDGVDLHWNYDPASEQLDVECRRVPFWINSNNVSQLLRNEIEAVIEKNRAA